MGSLAKIFIPVFLSASSAFAFEVEDHGTKRCEGRESISFLNSNGDWKRFKNIVLLSSGTIFEFKVNTKSKLPHVVLLRSEGASRVISLNRKPYRKLCKRFLDFTPNEKPELKNEVVLKNSYYSFFKDGIGGPEGDLLNSYNINFYNEKEKKCMNTKYFGMYHEFDEGDIKTAKGYWKRGNLGGEVIADTLNSSKETMSTILVSPTSLSDENTCIYVRVKASQGKHEKIGVSVRPVGG